METLLLWIGRAAGLFGALVCAAAVVIRLSGRWYLGVVPVGTLLQLGIAAMILGCLAYAAVSAERRRN